MKPKPFADNRKAKIHMKANPWAANHNAENLRPRPNQLLPNPKTKKEVHFFLPIPEITILKLCILTFASKLIDD